LLDHCGTDDWVLRQDGAAEPYRCEIARQSAILLRREPESDRLLGKPAAVSGQNLPPPYN
jgi:hypothetical protein